MNKHDIALRILSVLEKETFNDWYTKGRFNDYIECNPGPDGVTPTEENILEDIEKKFHL